MTDDQRRMLLQIIQIDRVMVRMAAMLTTFTGDLWTDLESALLSRQLIGQEEVMKGIYPKLRQNSMPRPTPRKGLGVAAGLSHQLVLVEAWTRTCRRQMLRQGLRMSPMPVLHRRLRPILWMSSSKRAQPSREPLGMRLMIEIRMRKDLAVADHGMHIETAVLLNGTAVESA